MRANQLNTADQQRLRLLRRMKTLALSLLIIAAIIYLATLTADQSGAWGWVNTGAEAAMVGAMADWFAVTALFRHPLGLPIPHTAIVPTKKDEIALSLEDFFTENFLTEEVARDRLAAANLGLRVGRWLEDEGHAARVSTEFARIARAGVTRVGDDDVRGLVDDVVMPRLAREPMASLAGDLLTAVVADGAHRGFIDLVVREVRDWLTRHPDSFKRMVANRAPWWAPDAVSTRVVDWTYTQALDWAQSILDDPNHPTRTSIDDLLLRIADDLQHDPEVQARAEALKARLLTHPQLAESAVNVWHTVRDSVTGALDDPGSRLHARLRQALTDVGATLVTNDAQRERLESRVADIVAFFVNTYGGEVSSVISHTIQRWDGEEASRRIELHVGRDLQFIRINGTVVGCLVGLLIHAVTLLVR